PTARHDPALALQGLRRPGPPGGRDRRAAQAPGARPLARGRRDDPALHRAHPRGAPGAQGRGRRGLPAGARQAALVLPRAGRARLCARLARLHEFRLDDLPGAAALYERAAETQRNDAFLVLARVRVARRIPGDPVAPWIDKLAASTRDVRMALSYLRLRALY